MFPAFQVAHHKSQPGPASSLDLWACGAAHELRLGHVMRGSKRVSALAAGPSQAPLGVRPPLAWLGLYWLYHAKEKMSSRRMACSVIGTRIRRVHSLHLQGGESLHEYGKAHDRAREVIDLDARGDFNRRLLVFRLVEARPCARVKAVVASALDWIRADLTRFDQPRGKGMTFSEP